MTTSLRMYTYHNQPLHTLITKWIFTNIKDESSICTERAVPFFDQRESCPMLRENCIAWSILVESLSIWEAQLTEASWFQMQWPCRTPNLDCVSSSKASDTQVHHRLFENLTHLVTSISLVLYHTNSRLSIKAWLKSCMHLLMAISQEENVKIWGQFAENGVDALIEEIR